jgi:hypothetical protein
MSASRSLSYAGDAGFASSRGAPRLSAPAASTLFGVGFHDVGESTVPWKAGDVRLPRVHAYLREIEARTVPAPAQDDADTDEGEAQRGENRTPASLSPPDPTTGKVAGERGARALCLLCRAHQRGRRLSVLLLGGSPLASIALAAQPEGKGAVVTHGAVPHPVDPSGSNPPSSAGLMPTPWRDQSTRT